MMLCLSTLQKRFDQILLHAPHRLGIPTTLLLLLCCSGMLHAQGAFESPVDIMAVPSHFQHSEFYATDMDDDGQTEVLFSWYFFDGLGCHPTLEYNWSVATFDTAGYVDKYGLNTQFQDGRPGTAVGDLDGDGDKDFAVSAQPSALGPSDPDYILWCENLGGTPVPAFARHELQTGRHEVDIGDVNMDGLNDILYCSGPWSGVRALVNSGGGVFSDSLLYVVDLELAWMEDLNGDGQGDVVGITPLDSVVWLRYQTGSGYAAPERVIADKANLLRWVDMDVDGDLDLLAAHTDSDALQWYANSGTGLFGAGVPVSAAVERPTDMALIDVDQDGDYDVVSGSAEDHTMRWHRNLGDAMSFAPGVDIHTFPASTGWGAVHTVMMDTLDYNRDGWPDLIANGDRGPLMLFKNNKGSEPAHVALVPSTPDLSIHPNPAATSTRLTWDAALHVSRVEVHDAQGRLVHQRLSPSGESHTLNVQAWPPGIYQVLVHHSGGPLSRTLVVP